MYDAKYVYLLRKTLKKVIAKEILFSFRKLKCVLLSQLACKNLAVRRIGTKKTKILRCVNWMIKSLRVNVIQRAFWRWKFQVYPIASNRTHLFNNKSKLACLISIRKSMEFNLALILSQQFSKWLTYSRMSSPKSITFLSLKPLIMHLSKPLSHTFNEWKLYCYKKSMKLYTIKSLSRLFTSFLRIRFGKWKEPEYEYEEQIVETVTRLDKVTKRFSVVKKPITLLEYYDFQWYDPAYRAVFRGMRQFIKRRIREAFKLWAEYMKRMNNQIETISGFLGKQGYSKLLPTETRKLKLLVIQFQRIQTKICEIPLNYLNFWMEKAHIKSLKEIRFKHLIMHYQRMNQKKKLFFTNMKHKIQYNSAFTDIN